MCDQDEYQRDNEKDFQDCIEDDTVHVETNQPEFEINRFFNDLPIRILNSHQIPFFYADDITKILGIRNTKTSVKNFDENELVSQELRQKYNITTYRKYKNAFRRDNKMILLTEYGVYRLLLTNRSEKAAEFKKFLYNILHQLRTVGEYKVKAELDQLKIINETNLAEIGILRQTLDVKDKKISQFKNFYNLFVLPGLKYQQQLSGHIYFIAEEPFRNKVKIGMSQNPQRRVKDLQTGNPNTLVLRHVTQYDEYKALERTMHEICKDLRGIGEWFDITESELTGLVSAL